MLGGALAGLLVAQLGFPGLFGWGSVPFALATAIIGALIGSVGGTRIVSWGTAAVGVIFLLVAFTPIVSRPASRWIRADALPKGPADAVVVLSSGTRSDTALDVSGTERLLTGLDVARATGTRRLVTTRVSESRNGRTVTSDRAQAKLISAVSNPPEWLIAESVASTRDEATHSAVVLFPLGARRIYLVTSPIHTRRACAAFEAVGFSVVCVPAVELDANSHGPDSPSDRLSAAQSYLRERLGAVLYRRKGWLPLRRRWAPRPERVGYMGRWAM